MNATQTGEVRIGDVRFANDAPLAGILGINVLESAELTLEVAQRLAEICGRLQMPWVFKASFDKANRTSADSFRGPGLDEGLRLLQQVSERTGVPVLTDIHEPEQAAVVAEVCQGLQIPAFLCRQTDLLQAAASTGAALHIKKAQFLAPEDMRHVVDKCRRFGNDRLLLCERGNCFGYHNLVVDMLGFAQMKAIGVPVTFDVTHALQLPGAGGAGGEAAGGRRTDALNLALAGVSQGLAGLFLECHPRPDEARCDGMSALRLEQVEPFLQRVCDLDALIKSMQPLEIH